MEGLSFDTLGVLRGKEDRRSQAQCKLVCRGWNKAFVEHEKMTLEDKRNRRFGDSKMTWKKRVQESELDEDVPSPPCDALRPTRGSNPLCNHECSDLWESPITEDN
ncbi:hypothetical protein Droror1_Dr00011777 [Drosera rotundifolia]